jgi:hypothetical protein
MAESRLDQITAADLPLRFGRYELRIGTIRAEPSFSLRASARLRGSDS